MSSIIPGQIVIQKPGLPPDIFYTPYAHQAEYHASTAKHCIMEGGAGSGKSKAIRYDCYTRCLTIPNFRAIILRRNMPELRRSHIEHIPSEIVRLGLSVNAFHQTYNVIRFPNGSTLTLDHFEDDQSFSRFLSQEAELWAFDELCTFTLKQFKNIRSRARTTIPGLTPLIRGGTNPIGIGASWVRRYFITKSVSKDEDRTYRPEDFHAIHSTAEDNPALNPDYLESLEGLASDAMVRAMRYGEWVIEGAAFPEFAPLKDGRPWHVIGEMPRYRGAPIHHAPHIEIVCVVDWGYAAEGNPGACVWFACLPDGSAIGFQEYYFKETLPEDVAKEILRRSSGLRVRMVIGDGAMWSEHTGPSVAERFAGAGLSMIEADKKREPGWIELHTWFKQTVDDGTGRRPRLSFLETGCPTVIQTLPDMAIDPKNPADIASVGVEDEGADICRYFVMSRPGRSREAPTHDANPEVTDIRKLMAKKQRAKRWRVGWESTRTI